jgi:NHL repeat
MSIRRVTTTGLVTLTVIGGGLAFAGAPSLGAGRVLHEFSKAFGTAGSGNGQFNDPVKVAVDETSGDVYVADQGNGRVQKFDAEGNYLSQFNGSETPNPNPGEFAPRYLAVDNACARHEPVLTGGECEAYDPSAGDIYVLDAANGVIDKYSPIGQYLSRLSAAGGPIQRAVAVDTTGKVIVISGEPGQIATYDDALNNNLLSSVALDFANVQIGYGIAVRSDELIYFLAYGSFAETTNILGESSGEEIVSVGSGGSGGGSTDLAIDLSTGELYADIGRGLRAYDESYSEVEELGAGILTGSTGMAVNSTTHTVYAADPASSDVVIFVSVPLPDVSTEPATNIQARSATLNGTVVSKAGLETLTIQFAYGTNGGPTVTITTSPAICSAGGASCPVSANLTGLLPNTTYHYLLNAANIHGTQTGNEETFTTSLEAPAVDGEYTPAVTLTSAILVARINPENDATSYRFEYGADAKYGTTVPAAEALVGSGYGDVGVAEGIEGLQPDTTYHYRVVATNSAGPPVYGPDQTFTTRSPTPPVLGTVAADWVSQKGVRLSGTVDPRGVQTRYEFDLGVDTSYGTSVFGDAGFAEGPVSVTSTFDGLAAGATYHYRFVASNIYGTIYGPDQTFVTPEYANVTLTAPPVAGLVAGPQVAFPSDVLVNGAPKAKKPAKKKRRKAKKARKSGMAHRAGHRHGGHGRGE